jgi:hypothetical protein
MNPNNPTFRRECAFSPNGMCDQSDRKFVGSCRYCSKRFGYQPIERPKEKAKFEDCIVPEEFSHVLKILKNGAKKYGANSWLYGNHFDVHMNHRSMAHHLLESYRELREDKESGLDPLLHLATRALMEYTLRARGRIDKNGKVIK